MRTPAADSTLLARLKAGDERALVELIDTHGSKIYRLAFRYLRNKEDAEEITQDVLYKVFRNAGAFRGDSALSSWIYRITFNAAMSLLRTTRYQQSRIDETPVYSGDGERLPAAPASEPADWTNMADQLVFRQQLRRRLYRAILSLPVIYRAPVVLRDLQGMSTEEASARLRVKDQTLKSRLHRGRVMLRKQLADFSGGLSLHGEAA